MREISVGFTGSQDGLSVRQGRSLNLMVDSLVNTYDKVVFHHGGCVDGDVDFHDIVLDVCKRYKQSLGHKKEIVIVLHPAVDEGEKVCCKGHNRLRFVKVIRLPLEKSLDRNGHIVSASSYLFAAPHKPEAFRSGTWATIRRARDQGKPVILFEF